MRKMRTLPESDVPAVIALTREQEVVWLAGVISIYGSFTYLQSRGVARLVFRSVLNPEVVLRVAEMAGSNVSEFTANGGAKGLIVQVSGGPLDTFMLTLWPYLSDTRRKEYRHITGSIRERRVKEEERKKRARDEVKAAFEAKRDPTREEELEALAVRQNSVLDRMGYPRLGLGRG